MIELLQKKSLKFFHPVLRRVAKYYLSKPRDYTYEGITVKVLPSVFHPGLFFSTKVFLDYLKKIDLKNKKVLELGAGSGLISIFCNKQGAQVVSSDINPVAIQGIKGNAVRNKAYVTVVLSDLFEGLSGENFDLILINPPYYPKNPKNEEEQAWFCGEEFEYFQRLSKQLKIYAEKDCIILMILSEDCDIERITSIINKHHLNFQIIFTKTINGEENYIFKISTDLSNKV